MNVDLRPLPSFITTDTRSDLTARVLADLESSDPYTRRDARARLTDLIDIGISENELSKLIAQMDSGSYRYQLGVSVALANSSASAQLKPSDRKELEKLLKSTSDPTLKKSIKAIK